MGELSYSRMRERVRGVLRDVHALLLDDETLDDLINESQREYALLSGSLTGEAEVTDTGNGVWEGPGDWIELIRFSGIDGLDVPLYSWRKLQDDYGDFREIAGDHVRYIIPDFDGFGRIRMFPKSRIPRSVGKVYYKRLPVKNRLEVRNEDAVYQHVLFMASMLTDKSSGGEYYRKYLDSVNKERNQLRGIGTSSRIRRGRFF